MLAGNMSVFTVYHKLQEAKERYRLKLGEMVQQRPTFNWIQQAQVYNRL